MLLVALWMLYESYIATSLVMLTSNEMLAKQMKNEIRSLLPDSPIKFLSTDEVHDLPVADVYLIDEADSCLENFITFNRNGEMDGFVNVKQSKCVYYFSATIPRYFENLISACHAPISKTEFKSRY